jgi:hypothetical protein
MKHGILYLKCILIFVFAAASSGCSLDGSGKKLPDAEASASNQLIIKGESVTLDGSESSDPDGTIVNYEWREGTTVLSTAISFAKEDFTLGTHVLTLAVTDNDHSTVCTNIPITVSNPATTSYRLKKTGQTISYTENGTEAADGSIKDDGHYQKGIAMDYSRDDTNQIVTDNSTGLMWQDNEKAKNITKQWLSTENSEKCSEDIHNEMEKNCDGDRYTACNDTRGDTAAAYCETLTLGGYSDWRLPTQKELTHIVDRGRNNPSIDPTFKHTASDEYWSMTRTSVDTGSVNWDFAFSVRFEYGDNSTSEKSSQYHVRCVRTAH